MTSLPICCGFQGRESYFGQGMVAELFNGGDAACGDGGQQSLLEAGRFLQHLEGGFGRGTISGIEIERFASRFGFAR